MLTLHESVYHFKSLSTPQLFPHRTYWTWYMDAARQCTKALSIHSSDGAADSPDTDLAICVAAVQRLAVR